MKYSLFLKSLWDHKSEQKPVIEMTLINKK